MKLAHDIEGDLEHTIPPEGGADSQWLFGAMTERSLALLELRAGERALDLACGMGQDALVLADGLAGGFAESGDGPSALRPVGLEPSNRMIRFAQWQARRRRDGSPKVMFVRALAEELPFATETFDAILCKGAMDHFMEPALTMAEVGRVLKPGGRAVLAIANFDSLSCRLGRWWDQWSGAGARRPKGETHPYYEPPPDHMTRFGHTEILALARPPLKVARVEGLSLLWQFPPWSALLARLPKKMGNRLARGAGFVARSAPSQADVIVLQAVKES